MFQIQTDDDDITSVLLEGVMIRELYHVLRDFSSDNDYMDCELQELRYVLEQYYG